MNSSAGEETLSAAEIPETNQVTVATVTTTSTTNTQTVVLEHVIYLYLLIIFHNWPYLTIVINHLVTSKVLLIIKSALLIFLGQLIQLHLLRYRRLTMYTA